MQSMPAQTLRCVVALSLLCLEASGCGHPGQGRRPGMVQEAAPMAGAEAPPVGRPAATLEDEKSADKEENCADASTKSGDGSPQAPGPERMADTGPSSTVEAPVPAISPTVFASRQDPTDFVVTAGEAFWTNDCDEGRAGSDPSLSRTIVRAPEAGGATEVLARDEAGCPRSIAADSSHIYWISDYTMVAKPYRGPRFGPEAFKIRRVSKRGGPVQTLTSVDQSTATGLVVSGGFVYWAPGYQHKVMRMPVAGGRASQVASTRFPAALRLRSGHLYWEMSGPSPVDRSPSVQRLALAGGRVQQVYVDSANAAGMRGFETLDGTVFVLTNNGHATSLVAVTTSGATNARTIASVPGLRVLWNLAASPGFAYAIAVKNGEQVLIRVSTDDGSVETVASAGIDASNYWSWAYVANQRLFWRANDRIMSRPIATSTNAKP